MPIFDPKQPPMFLPTEMPPGGFRGLIVELSWLAACVAACSVGFAVVTFLYASAQLYFSESGVSLWTAFALTWESGLGDIASRLRCDPGMEWSGFGNSFLMWPIFLFILLYMMFGTMAVGKRLIHESNAFRFILYVMFSYIPVGIAALLFPGGCMALGGVLPEVGGSLLRQSDFNATVIFGPVLLGIFYLSGLHDLAKWRKANGEGSGE